MPGLQLKVKPTYRRLQEGEVSASVLYMSMSLDGYIARPNDDPEPRRRRLHAATRLVRVCLSARSGWGLRPHVQPRATISDEIRATGAVVSGRNTVEQVDHWAAITTTVSLFSCRVTGPRDRLSRTIRW